MGHKIEESTIYRRLWLSDTPALLAHLLRLPKEARYNRFGMGVSNEFVASYSSRSFGPDNVIVGYFAGGVLRAVGELRPVNPVRTLGIGGDMEAAFSVEPAWQGNGVGSELMRQVIRAAQTRSCHTLYLSFLSGNHSMRRLAMKFDARIEVDHGEMFGKISPGYASPADYWQEGMSEAASFAIAALDVQARRLRHRTGPQTR